MALTDLIENARGFLGNSPEGDDVEEVEVPDDASELTEGEDGDLLPPDPKPSRKGPTKRRQPTGKVTAAQRRGVQDALVLMMTIPGGILQMRDPLCAGVLLDNADTIAAKMVPLITRNPAALAWFIGSAAPWMDWLALITALTPVVSTFWGHHVTHSIGHDVEGEHGGDFSQYSAPVFA